MPFSGRPTSRLLTESWTLTIWPWTDLDLAMTMASFMTLTSDKLNQVKLMSRCQISISHEMTLTLTQWPWYSNLSWIWSNVPPYQNEVSMSTGSKVIAWTHTHTYTDTDTHRHTQTHTDTDTMKTLPLPHTQEVKILSTDCYLPSTFWDRPTFSWTLHNQVCLIYQSGDKFR